MSTKIATPAGQAIVQPGSPPSRWILGQAGEAVTKNQIICITGSATSGVAISATSKGSEIQRRMGVATNVTRAKAMGALYLALHSQASVGGRLEFTDVSVLNNLDTSGSAIGAPVYLGTAGAPTLTRPTGGYARQIGEVIFVGVAGTGLWSFHGGLGIGSGDSILTGIAVILNTASSVTVTNPFGIGAQLTGRPVWAALNEVEAGEGISSVVWSGNDLVIASIGATSADRDVRYFILG
jgi:hypothetical protein